MRKVLFVLLVITASGFAQEQPPDLKSQVDAIAHGAVEKKSVVGMSVGILVGGEKQTLHYGRVSLESDQPPDDQTYYEIGSITKTFTGILLADAAARGEVKLDDPVNVHLPENARLADNGHPITLTDLATHSSGMPRMPGNWKPGDPANPYADYTPEMMYKFIGGLKPPRAPGEKYEYSNLAVGLLGNVLTTKAGKNSWEELALERLIKPLGMNDTRLNWTRKMHDHMAKGYTQSLKPAANWDIPTFAGAGGLRSTIPDMLIYAEANVNPPENDLGKAIRESHVQRFSYPNAPGGTALCWHIGAATNFRWHTGQTGGYHTYIAVGPRDKIAVVVLSNTATAKVDEVGEAILRAVIVSQQKK